MGQLYAFPNDTRNVHKQVKGWAQAMKVAVDDLTNESKLLPKDCLNNEREVKRLRCPVMDQAEVSLHIMEASIMQASAGSSSPVSYEVAVAPQKGPGPPTVDASTDMTLTLHWWRSSPATDTGRVGVEGMATMSGRSYAGVVNSCPNRLQVQTVRAGRHVQKSRGRLNNRRLSSTHWKAVTSKTRWSRSSWRWTSQRSGVKSERSGRLRNSVRKR